MATNVLMPKWGMSMQEGLVSCWLKKQGDLVEQGEAIVEVESSKATDFVEAPVSGVLARILVPEGDTVPITTVIAIIAAPGEETPATTLRADFRQHDQSVGQKSPATQVQDAGPPQPPHTSRATSTTRRILADWSAGVIGLPSKELAKPHCGERQRLSSGT